MFKLTLALFIAFVAVQAQVQAQDTQDRATFYCSGTCKFKTPQATEMSSAIAGLGASESEAKTNTQQNCTSFCQSAGYTNCQVTGVTCQGQ